jgi:hypothetical protein
LLGFLQALDVETGNRAVDAAVGQRELDRQRILAAPLRQQAAQRRDQREQLGHQHMALAHVDDLVRAALVEADQRLAPAVDRAQRGAAARTWRREVDGRDVFRPQPLPLGRVDHAVAHELAERRLAQMLQPAPAAARKVAARRLGAVRARGDRAVGRHEVARRGQRHMAARRGDAVAPGRYPHDWLALAHRAAA